MTVAKFSVLARPDLWPRAAQLLEAAERGDGSVIKDFANNMRSDAVRLAFEQNGSAPSAGSAGRRSAG